MVSELKRISAGEYTTFGIKGVCSTEVLGIDNVEQAVEEVCCEAKIRHFSWQTNVSTTAHGFFVVHIIIFDSALFRAMWDNSENLIEIK